MSLYCVLEATIMDKGQVDYRDGRLFRLGKYLGNPPPLYDHPVRTDQLAACLLSADHCATQLGEIDRINPVMAKLNPAQPCTGLAFNQLALTITG